MKILGEVIVLLGLTIFWVALHIYIIKELSSSFLFAFGFLLFLLGIDILIIYKIVKIPEGF